MVRFAGFDLDPQRAELRRPDGSVVRLRQKTLDMLGLFIASPGRMLSKQHLMETVWPNIHVAEDSLFQCISELRTALGDTDRQMVRLVSGQGYVFALEQTTPAPSDALATPAKSTARTLPAPPVALALIALMLVAGIALAATLLAPKFAAPPPTIIAVMPLAGAGELADTATRVTTLLGDGLARIDNIRVALPSAGATPVADYVVTGELRKTAGTWVADTRMVETATRGVQSVASISVDIGDSDPQLQHSRLAAGIGHALALRLNALRNIDAGPADANAQVAIEQANAAIAQTSPERFADAHSMLERAIATSPDNVDLAVALAALQLRGIQMVWYAPEASLAAEASARTTLERARRLKPASIPVLEAHCRFLNATNRFTESLVACAQTLSLDPWNGIALYHIGLAQLQLGRFDDSLATFTAADQFDTPQMARWTWLVGAGWVNLLMGRNEAALDGLTRSIAITPASGRPLMLLAAAYQRLGRHDEARAALATALALRPGTTALNVAPPTKGASPVFLAASTDVIDAMIAAGLPAK